MNAEIDIFIEHSYSNSLDDREIQKNEVKKKIVATQSERNENCLVDVIPCLKVKTEHDVKKAEDKKSITKSIKKFTVEMKYEIQRKLESFSRHGTVAQSKYATVLFKDLRTLKGNMDVNDQVVNQYMWLIKNRRNGAYPTVFCFTSFFYSKLTAKDYQYDKVQRWTKEIDIFGKDLLIFPIHMPGHWCLAVVNNSKKELKYYDSMGSPNDTCLDIIMNYLRAEAKAKERLDIFGTFNKINTLRKVPQQRNSCDCGVFICTFAEYLSRGAQFDFGQEDMYNIRANMVYEITTGRLLN